MLGMAMLYRRRNCIILYVHCAGKASFVSGNSSFMELMRARRKDADDLTVCSQIPHEISKSTNITISFSPRFPGHITIITDPPKHSLWV